MDISGTTATPKASRYLQQVCKHWGHRFTSTFDETQGNVDFGDGSSVDLRADGDTLHMVLHCEPKDGAMMREIVEEHIQRFANKEGTLIFDWAE